MKVFGSRHARHALRHAGVVALLGAFVASAACDDGVLDPERTGAATILLSQTNADGDAPALAEATLAAAAPSVTLEQVASIDVTLTEVQALRTGSGDDDGSAWASLFVEQEELDLMALPEEGVVVASGDLEPGEYSNVRFFLDDATITFDEEVTLGSGASGVGFDADEPHPLFIPSADETGLKVPTAGFVVGEGDEEVVIRFDSGESVQNLAVTANGILMNPVLTAKGADEDADDNDGDEGSDGNDGNGNDGNGDA